MRLNLIYSIYARADNDDWRMNLDELSDYSHIFDGNAYFIIRHDDTTENFEFDEFQKGLDLRFKHSNNIIIILRNSPILAETHYFLNVLADSLLDKTAATFYAHTKGVTHAAKGDEIIVPIRKWRKQLYKSCLENPNLIKLKLQSYACAGAYKTTGVWSHLPSWIYNGNFWWVSNQRLLSVRWQTIEQSRFGVEGYLGNLFSYEDAYCLYGGDNPSRNLYLPAKKSASTCRRCGFTSRLDIVRCTYCHGEMM